MITNRISIKKIIHCTAPEGRKLFDPKSALAARLLFSVFVDFAVVFDATFFVEEEVTIFAPFGLVLLE